MKKIFKTSEVPKKFGCGYAKVEQEKYFEK